MLTAAGSVDRHERTLSSGQQSGNAMLLAIRRIAQPWKPSAGESSRSGSAKRGTSNSYRIGSKIFVHSRAKFDPQWSKLAVGLASVEYEVAWHDRSQSTFSPAQGA